MKPTEQLKSWLVSNYQIDPTAGNEEFMLAAKSAILDGVLTDSKFAELTGEQMHSTTPRELFGGSKSAAGRVNVREPSERYKTFKYRAKHVRTGEPVRDAQGAEVESLSERDYAKIGAYIKHMAGGQGKIPVALNEHEQQMVAELYGPRERWTGDFGGKDYKTDWTGNQVKALLNDSTSGGSSLVPYVYDQAIVTFPLLSGELFPYVDLVDVPRSNTVHTASIGNPTMTWGQSDGTAVTLFDTTSLAVEIDTSIFNCMLSIEVGRNELADSIVDVGKYIVDVVGNRYAADLDRVIAVGNGSTEPQGIANSGISTVPNISNGLGPMSVSDLEQLYFGVQKQFRKPQYRPCFISSDTTYSRCRAIPVGANDARRVLGMDEGSYDALSMPWRVNNDMANNYLIFGCMALYRFYRRQGMETRWVTEGQTLALKNTALMVMYTRAGGRVVNTNAFLAETNVPQ